MYHNLEIFYTIPPNDSKWWRVVFGSSFTNTNPGFNFKICNGGWGPCAPDMPSTFESATDAGAFSYTKVYTKINSLEKHNFPTTAIKIHSN